MPPTKFGLAARRDFLRLSAAAAGAATFGVGPRLQAAERWSGGVADVVGRDAATGTSAAVVVGNVPLIHTDQLYQADAVLTRSVSLRLAVELQWAAVVEQLKAVLAPHGATLDDVVKFNFYVTRDEALPLVHERLRTSYGGDFQPAVTFAVGTLENKNCVLAVDCVAIARGAGEKVAVSRSPGAAVLPPLHKLYVSGDAQQGAVPDVVGPTLDSLQQTLTHAGADWSHVVQLKTFLQPMEAAADVRRAIGAYFGKRPMPVLSLVEWKSSAAVPLEIELVAAVPPENGNREGVAVEYLTPSHLKPSPVFSRAARVRSEQTIYVSGLYGEATDPAEQVHNLFAKLKQIVEPLGSDLRHLVKATYYVADDETSRALGAIRPEYYDAARPPAASKALVSAVGRAGRTLAVDMIAVPSEAGQT